MRLSIPQPPLGSIKGTVAIVRHEGRSYEQRLIDCRKPSCKRCGTSPTRTPSHGPYWYLCAQTKAGWRRLYLGKSLNTQLYIRESGAIDWPAYAADRRRKKTPAPDTAQNSNSQAEIDKPNTSTSQPSSTHSGNPPAPPSPGSPRDPHGGHSITTANPIHLLPLFETPCCAGPVSPDPPGKAPSVPDQLDFFTFDPDDPFTEYVPHFGGTRFPNGAAPIED